MGLPLQETLFLSFNWIVASRELPKFGGSAYNDKFVMEINGALRRMPTVAPPRSRKRRMVAQMNAEVRRAASVDEQRVLTGNPIATLSNGKVVSINNLVPFPQTKSDWSSDYIDNPNRDYFGFTGYTKLLVASGQVHVYC